MILSEWRLREEKRNPPVFDKRLKKDDFPTFGKPVHIKSKLDLVQIYSYSYIEHDVLTYDADLQVVPGATQDNLRLLFLSFLRGHSAFRFDSKSGCEGPDRLTQA